MDIKEALNRLPKEVVDARHARLKRAIDLSMKHEYLPEDLQVDLFIYFVIFVFGCCCKDSITSKMDVDKLLKILGMCLFD